jgi:hypothetical protein
MGVLASIIARKWRPLFADRIDWRGAMGEMNLEVAEREFPA